MKHTIRTLLLFGIWLVSLDMIQATCPGSYGLAGDLVVVVGSADDPIAKQAKQTEDFWIAPNPSPGDLYLYSSGKTSDGILVHVYTMVGTKLHTFRPEELDGKLMLKGDTGSWLPGTYLVQIERNGVVLKTMRFVRK